MNDKCNKYENLSDILEYGNISAEEAVCICNSILEESNSENDFIVLESMFHAIFTAITNRNIGNRINTDIIAKNLEKYNEEILDYIITILAYSGNEQYQNTIKQIGSKYKNLDIEDALMELSARMEKYPASPAENGR